MGDPHVVLELGHILFAGRFLGKRPGQHEFGFEYGSGFLYDASRVATIQGIAECLTRRWTPVTCRPVLRSYQVRLRSSVAVPNCTIKLPDRSSRFSRQRRTRGASSLPIMMRASDPPMKPRRSNRE